MKKSALSLLVLALAGIYLFFSGELSLTTHATKVDSFVEDQGDIKVYFCPHEQCDVALDQFLKSAEESIHCALFELDLENLQETILEKEEEIDVKIVTDNNYLYEFNHSFVKTDTWGLMHNKFCIVDGKAISTGSMNPTNNGAHKNNNHLLIINSPALATNYEAEFEEHWNLTFKKGGPTPNPSIMIGDVQIQNYFCPEDECAYHVKEELKKAQTSIDFMTFSFTHPQIANALLLAHNNNVSVRGVYEARQVSKYSTYEQLKFQGLDVKKDANKANMHHKVFIIDNKTVVAGSFNPSKSGDERNDENILVIHDDAIAQEFLEEFSYVFNQES